MKKYYFTSLAFSTQDGKVRSVTIKGDKNNLTAPDIRAAMKDLEIDESAALLSVSSLGRMTDTEFSTGQVPVYPIKSWLWRGGISLMLLVSVPFSIYALWQM